MEYEVIRTDTANVLIRKIILYIAANFDMQTALEKIDELEKGIMPLAQNPYLGTEPQNPFLKRKKFRLLILGKNGVFYKVDENNKKVIIHAVIDLRQDYINIIKGL